MHRLIVENQTILQDLLSTIVDSFTEVTQVFKAETVQAAGALLCQHPMDLAILCLQLPDSNGSDFGTTLIQHNSNIQLIIFQGSADTFLYPKKPAKSSPRCHRQTPFF